MKIALEALQPKRQYNFVAPKDEYPPCSGVCTVVGVIGNMIELIQEEDKANPKSIRYDARGEKQEKPREIGLRRRVHYNSFESIDELSNKAG